MADGTPEADWTLIETLLPRGWRELATQMRLVKPRPAHLGQKIFDISIALRLVLHYVAQRGSQRATIAAAAAAGLVAISQVALFKWMRKIGPYLEALIALLVDPAPFASERWGSYQLVVADATTVERPGAKGTTARLHYGMQLGNLQPRSVRITDASVGETMKNFDPDPGELWIVDRGYANPPSIEAVVDRRSDLLVRHNRGALPVFDVHQNRLHVPTLISATTERGQAKERKVYVHTAEGRRWAVRLCWIRLSAQDAAKARARAARDGAPTEEREAADYVVVVTTVPKKRLDATQILALYRSRWQVELEFKRDKSIGELDRLPSLNPITIHAWLCAKVLLGLLVRRLVSEPVAFPPGGVAAALLPACSDASACRPRGRAGRRTVVRDAGGLDAAASGPAVAAVG